jgi:hypothetical protein
VDDKYWAEFRKRARTRTSRQMALLICPFMVVIAVLKLVEPMDYPIGDVRNSITFRLIFYGLFIGFAVVGFVASVRWLIADRRR